MLLRKSGQKGQSSQTSESGIITRTNLCLSQMAVTVKMPVPWSTRGFQDISFKTTEDVCETARGVKLLFDGVIANDSRDLYEPKGHANSARGVTYSYLEVKPTDVNNVLFKTMCTTWWWMAG